MTDNNKPERINKAVKRNRIIAVSLMVLSLVTFIFAGQYLYFRPIDATQIRLRGFYLEEEDSLDVIFFGSSEIYQGVSSSEIYRTTGVTSYPYAFPYNPSELWCYGLKEVLKTQHPKVLVVEINGACYVDDVNVDYPAVRSLADSMPLSQNKIDLINDMATESKFSFYMPIMKYHSNWKKNPFNLINPAIRGYNLLKGNYLHAQNKPIYEGRFERDESRTPLTPKQEEDLNKFLDLCDESGIEHIVFTRFPHVLSTQRSYDRYQKYRTIGLYVEERGYEYIDFDEMTDEIGLDEDLHYYDGEHLNGYGQQIFTDWLAKYLVEKYNLSPTELSEEKKAEWDTCSDYILRFYKLYDDNIKKNGFYEPTPEEEQELKKQGIRFFKELHEYRRVMKALEAMGSTEG